MAKKGQNNFKEMQQKKVRETTFKIEKSLSKMPKKIDKPSLSKVIKFVAKDTGIHFTTLYKNEKYKEMCNQEFLRMSISNVGKKKDKDIEVLEGKIRLLELENANLKNQIIGLNNVVKRLENGSDVVNENNVYKENFEALLNHFSDQLEIKDGKIIDPFGGIRPVEICEIGDEK